MSENLRCVGWSNLETPINLTFYDPLGKLGFDLGVYGAPETYIIDKRGLVRYRHVGELNERVWRNNIEPVLRNL